MLRKILLASIVAAGVVSAQRTDPCKAKSNTIRGQGDLDTLANCQVLDGDLIIEEGLPIVNLNFQSIKGSLISANNEDIQQLVAPSLNFIGGTWNLTALIHLNTLDFQALRQVNNIYWQTLTNLQALTFGTTGVIKADRVTITDTILESLNGINLVTVDQFNINNNKYLKEVNVQLANITDSLAIEFNGASVKASFPNLTWANNATFRSCGEVELPRLTTVNGSLGLFENKFEEFKVPRLTGIGTGTSGGDLTFANNDKLANISVPNVDTIRGTLLIVNGTALKIVDGFAKLATLYGSVDISGDSLEDVQLPSLKDVRGGFNLQSKGDLSCTYFDDNVKDKLVRGSYLCSGKLEDPGTEGTNAGASNGGSSNSDKKENAAGQLSVTNSFAAISAAALFAVFFL